MLLAYVVLPNLAFWLAGHMFETLPRATVNLDYLLIAIFVPFLRRWQSVTLTAVALLLDIARCLGPLYYFSQKDAISAVVFLRELSFTQVFLSALVVIVPSIALGWLLVSLGGSGAELKRNRALVVCVLVVFGSLGVWGGNSSLRFRDQAMGMNLCTSAGLSMAKTVSNAIFRKNDRVAPEVVDSATRRAGWFETIPVDRNLILVVLESGGEPVNPKWKDLMESEWKNPELLRRYRIETGEVPFSGATVPGEFRELCGVASGVIERPTDNVSIMKNCLPWRFQSAGMVPQYLHGFSAAMFNRAEWVGKLGFQKELFHPALRALGLADCGGPFRGTCDEDVAAFIGNELVADREHRYLIAWTTLNSHLPVEADAKASEKLKCGTGGAVVEDDASCNLIALLMKANHAVATLALRPDLPATEFVIVGDHAPPFIFKERRERFSQERVPYIHLTPQP